MRLSPTSHPVGMCWGAAIGSAAGGAAGTVAGGPIGSLVGMLIGATAGVSVGRQVARFLNISPVVERWRGDYVNSEYARAGVPLAAVAPGYEVGYRGYLCFGSKGTSFEAVEGRLRKAYESAKPREGLPWERLRPAVQEGWKSGQTGLRASPPDLELRGERATAFQG